MKQATVSHIQPFLLIHSLATIANACSVLGAHIKAFIGDPVVGIMRKASTNWAEHKSLADFLAKQQALTLRTSSIHCCQSSDRWLNIDQRSLTVSICLLRFCAMRARGESFGCSGDLSASYSSITLRAESKARSTTSLLTLSFPLNAYRRSTISVISLFIYLLFIYLLPD